eukprot:2870679-Alexandrium_andersonii.AAC.1
MASANYLAQSASGGAPASSIIHKSARMDAMMCVRVRAFACAHGCAHSRARTGMCFRACVLV